MIVSEIYTAAPTQGLDESQQAVFDKLAQLNIPFERVEHDWANTMEDCKAIAAVLGCDVCKNLVLCNRQKTQFYLLMLEGDKVFKTKDLSKQLGVSRLSFASADDMVQMLNVHPGSVTVLGLMNDPENKVQLVMDKPVYEGENVSCHPCISSSDLLEKLLPAIHHEPIVVDLPIPEVEE